MDCTGYNNYFRTCSTTIENATYEIRQELYSHFLDCSECREKTLAVGFYHLASASPEELESIIELVKSDKRVDISKN